VFGEARVCGNARVNSGYHSGTEGTAPASAAPRPINTDVADFAKLVSEFSKSLKIS
jgi:hypothetical protein